MARAKNKDRKRVGVRYIKPYLIIAITLLLLFLIFTFLLKQELIRKSPTDPSVSNVYITTPAYKDLVVFGYGDYSGTLPEKNSQYQWYKNDVPYDPQGTLSKSFLAHFDNSFISEENYGPIDNMGVNFVSGKYGQGVEIDSGDKLSYPMPTNAGFNISSGTIEMWVKPYWNSELISEDKYIFQNILDGDNRMFLFVDNDPDSKKLKFSNYGPSGSATGVKRIIWKPNEWHHVAITFDNGRSTIYADGQPSIEYDYYRTSAGSSFSLHAPYNEHNTKNFDGVIDELRIHNRKLTSDEIYESFALGRAGHSNEQMLDLSNLNIGDRLRFDYKPCNTQGSCGSWVSSPEVTIQQFTSTINVNANNMLHDVNRRLLGISFKYGDETNPQDCCWAGCGCNPDTGQNCCKLGSRIWDTTTNAPDTRTVGLVEPLRVGSTEYHPEATSTENTNHSIEFFRAIGVPDNANLYAFYHLWEITYNNDDRVLDMVQYAEDNNLNIDYWYYDGEEEGRWSLEHNGNMSGFYILYGSTPELYANVTNEYAPQIRAINNDAKWGVGVVSYNVPQDTDRDGDVDRYIPSLDTFLDLTGNETDFIFNEGGYVSYDVPDDNYPFDKLYDNYMGATEYELEEQKWFRNKLDTKYNDRYREFITEWATSAQNLDYSYDYYYVWHSLMAGLVDASYLNYLINDNQADAAIFWDWSYGGYSSLVGRNGETSVPYLVFSLYADYVGDQVVNSSVNALSFDAPGQGNYAGALEPRENMQSLNILSTIDSATNKLYVIVVNRDRLRDLTTNINIDGFNPGDIANTWTLDEHTDQCDEVLESRIFGPCRTDPFYFGPTNVYITESQITYASNSFQYTFPEHSITVFEFSGSGTGCECSGNSCEQGNTGRRCDGCNWYDISDVPESCDGLDNNCDNVLPSNEYDNDNDNYMICENDCDDNNPNINPSETELCDGINNDCNSEIDEGCNIQGFIAYKTSTPITIDGINNEWNNLDGFIPYTRWVSGPEPPIDNNDLSANFSALWDSNYLYIGIKVNDNILINDSQNNCNSLWLDDSVELYLDGLNDNCDNGCFDDPVQCPGNDQSTHLDDHQYTVDIENLLGGINSQANGPITHAVSTLTDGYFVEYAIPWSNLEVNPIDNLIIGFDLGINDDDTGGNSQSQLAWNGDGTGWYNTTIYGDLILSESQTPYCGNDILDEGEDCEGSNLNDYTCTSFGYTSGTLICSNCQFNTTLCTSPSAPPTDTSGGGGGGRGSNEGEAEAEAEAESEQITEQTIDVNLFDNQELTITSQLQQLIITVDNINEHVMQILSITDNQITFTLEGEESTLSIGGSKVLTLDGVNIQITLNSITNGNANLLFKRTSELPLPTKIKGKILPNLSIIIPLVIIIVIITLIILKKTKPYLKAYLKARARIYTLRKKGYNDNQIKDMFKKKGWSEQEIDKLFKK